MESIYKSFKFSEWSVKLYCVWFKVSND